MKYIFRLANRRFYSVLLYCFVINCIKTIQSCFEYLFSIIFPS